MTEFPIDVCIFDNIFSQQKTNYSYLNGQKLKKNEALKAGETAVRDKKRDTLFFVAEIISILVRWFAKENSTLMQSKVSEIHIVKKDLGGLNLFVRNGHFFIRTLFSAVN